MTLMKLIFDAYKINLIYNPPIEVLIDSNFTNNHIVYRDLVNQSAQVSKDNFKFRIATCQGGPYVLNVWIVNSVTGDGTRKLNGVSPSSHSPSLPA